MPAPNTMPNLAAWFVGGVGITSAAGAVSQWNDQSGNGRHLVQATGANQPGLQADGSILFNGSSHSLATSAFAVAQPYTCYLLFKQITWVAGARIFDGVGVANTPSIRQTTAGASPDVSLNAGADLTISTVTINVYAVVNAVVNGASSQIQSNNSTAATGNAGANGLTGITLGVSAGGAGFSNIQVKEVVLFSAAHDAPTRAAVIDYLNRLVPSTPNFVGGQRRTPYPFTPYIPRRLPQRKRRY